MAPSMQEAQYSYEDTRASQNRNVSKSGVEIGKEPSTKSASHDIADVFDISSAAALELLCFNIERLAQSTVQTPTDFLANSPDAHGENHSGEAPIQIRTAGLHATPTADDTAGRDLLQLSVLLRKFVSKKEPPISLRDYLLRLHKYCPMSTAVYLATSIYFTKMAVVQRILSVNTKNMHRLTLAGLGVAMKALEDLSYPHSRVAKVGGVSERELSKIEISFCFLVDFKLRVDAQMLLDEAKDLIQRCMGCEGAPEIQNGRNDSHNGA
ncbi:putative cyclin-dependent protein kinase complex component [Aspergillus chevalieri]|uniref:Cyclin-dependent protein kinase complex component n=1 Tax=Aspergillus chevalieri TaxID=182096 RepID=A0A7R7VS55_ASPCH|nr:uncharacterized protein ACHE_50307S [Aspergillus chevalieri]BCR89109.1 hypothetical protein ACHE_50307S [Aspergillus chevalieri]